jgi:hypothetical protein
MLFSSLVFLNCRKKHFMYYAVICFIGFAFVYKKLKRQKEKRLKSRKLYCPALI